MRANVVFAVLILSIAGCSGDKPDAQESPAEVAKKIRELMPEATSIPAAEFEAIATAQHAPSIEDFSTQSMAFVLMVMRVTDDDAKNAEFGFASMTPHPARLAEAMAKSKSKGYYALIQPEYIKDLTCEVKGDVATGLVTFEAAKAYRGKIEYSAKKSDGKWDVTEFRLPTWDITTTKGADGKWKASGEGIELPGA